MPTANSRTRYWLAPQLQMTETVSADYYQPASKKIATEHSTCTVVHDFGSRISINGKPDMNQLGSVLHHCLALVLAKPDIAVETLDKLVKDQIPGTLLGDQIHNQGLALFDWINTQHPDAILHTEMPIMKVLDDGSLRQGAIDLVVETSEGWIVIDHKSNPQPKEKWTEIAQEHSGQLQAYREVLESLSGKPVLETLIHFSVSGALVSVKSSC